MSLRILIIVTKRMLGSSGKFYSGKISLSPELESHTFAGLVEDEKRVAGIGGKKLIELVAFEKFWWVFLESKK